MSNLVNLASSNSDSDSDSTIPYDVSAGDSESSPIKEANSDGKKRKLATKEQDGKKKTKINNEVARQSISPKPVDGELGYRLVTVAGINKSFNEPAMAISLKSVLAGSPKYGSLISSVQFNYLFDMDWLMDHYPDDSETSPILIVHGFRGADETGLRMTASPYPQVTLAQAKLDSPYGTHHTKMMLLEYERGLRLVLHTANMIHEDWHQKTQLVWTSPFLPRRENGASGRQNSAFLAAVAQYLSAYNLPSLQEWAEKLQKFDFSAVNDDEVAFVASVPGRHSGSSLNSFGHMRLRSCLAKRQLKTTHSDSVRVIAQFSSIGSLGESAEKWVIPELVRSCLACFSPPSTLTATKPRPILIYPSVADVRGSLEGYAAGGSLPYRRDVADKQKWLNSLLHCWRANIVGRTKAMPHVKTFSAVSSDFSKIYFLLVTSANLSKAAWGKLEKNETQLGILSYEAGILLFPPREKQFWSISDVMLPFDLPPQPYGRGEEPWIADKPYTQRDSHNRTWLV